MPRLCRRTGNIPPHDGETGVRDFLKDKDMIRYHSKEEMVAFAKWAKDYKSKKDVGAAYEQWIQGLDVRPISSQNM